MFRFGRRNFRAFSTAAQHKETILEHLNTNGTGYSIMVGLIAATLGGLNYIVGLQMKPLQTDMKALKEDMKTLDDTIKKGMKTLDNTIKKDIKTFENTIQKDIKTLKEDMKEMKIQQKEDMKEIKNILIPLVVQVQVIKEQYDDLKLNKETSL